MNLLEIIAQGLADGTLKVPDEFNPNEFQNHIWQIIRSANSDFGTHFKRGELNLETVGLITNWGKIRHNSPHFALISQKSNYYLPYIQGLRLRLSIHFFDWLDP